MREVRYGKDASIIGEYTVLVTLETVHGTSRIVDMLLGELLPRIC